VKRNRALFGALAILLFAAAGYASGTVWSEVRGNIAVVHHDKAYFNCCPEMVFEIKPHADTNLIDIFEEDLDTHPCDCMCYFEFVHTLSGLEPGTYIARVWENNKWDTQGFALAGKTVFIIPELQGSYKATSARSECGGYWPGVQEDEPDGLKLTSTSPILSSAQISYTLPYSSSVTICIYSVIGTRVRTLNHGNQEQGEHTVTWDTRDDGGKALPRGIYFVRLSAAGQVRSLPVIVLK
jgi:hypothetical protein